MSRRTATPTSPAPPARLKLSLTAETGAAYKPFLRTYVRAAHTHLVAWASRPSARGAAALRKRSPEAPKPRKDAAMALHELSLVLVGDKRMSQLHEQFMGVPGPTDVLTFPMETDPRGRATSGEVIVCVPEALRQAKARTIPPRLELLLYALHGLLHLLGYDDRTDAAFRVMHRTEDAIMTELGFGPVFAARPAAQGRGGRR